MIKHGIEERGKNVPRLEGPATAGLKTRNGWKDYRYTDDQDERRC